MIEVKTRLGPARIVESVSELPTPTSIGRLYMDSETTSEQDTVAALYPYLGHRACGWAVTFDDAVGAWYVPIRHRSPGARNLPIEPVLRWLQDLLKVTVRDWVNANPKFDAHVLNVDRVSFGDVALTDVTTRAKMIDSDRFSHYLKDLCRDWLSLEMPEEYQVQQYLDGIQLPRRKKARDYGLVPIDILGVYACVDVLAARKLNEYLEEKMPAEQASLWSTEQKLTSILFDMEADGLRFDRRAAKIADYRCVKKMIECGDTVRELTGGIELVDSNDCFHEILVDMFDLPILGRTKTRTEENPEGNPSFDADVMLLYSGHPKVISDPTKRDVVKAMRVYREESRFKSLYVDSAGELIDARGYLHPSYNQIVRTGRMSASDWNPQQANARAKELIIPDEGEAFLCADASQIEFRLIVHYTKDENAIRAYAENPRTDYHQWVADLCEVERDPAKNLNFAMGYGAGKRRVTSMLMSDESLVEKISAEVDALIEQSKVPTWKRSAALEKACTSRANEIYLTYHQKLPNLKRASKEAEDLVKQRGWVKTAYGRRRHLDWKMARKGFNTVIQGTAMDAIKERMVTFAPRFNSRTRELGLKLLANVHDEVLSRGPREVVADPEVQRYKIELLEDTRVKFRVPILWDLGSSDKNWADAKPKKKKKIDTEAVSA